MGHRVSWQRATETNRNVKRRVVRVHQSPWHPIAVTGTPDNNSRSEISLANPTGRTRTRHRDTPYPSGPRRGLEVLAEFRRARPSEGNNWIIGHPFPSVAGGGVSGRVGIVMGITGFRPTRSPGTPVPG